MFLKILQNSQKKTSLLEYLFLKSCKLETLNWHKQPLGIVCEKKVFLKILQISQEKTCVEVFFLMKLEFWGPMTLLKNTPKQVLSCEI